MIDNSIEYIVCAAIWYKEFDMAAHGCVNIDRGIVVPGFRHAHCIGIMLNLAGKRTVSNAEDGVGEWESGFLTSHNRYVDRYEGKEIFERTTGKKTDHKLKLFSEDLY